MLNLPERLTHVETPPALKTLHAQMDALPTGTPVVIDGQRLNRFDSSALGVLLSCKRHALAQGRTFTTQALPARLVRLAGLYGLANCL
ncbi:STAS domain-containing protein [Sphaerotilus mobilis]|uniref:Phospholipid transport system transporter-binding protein n=1 Tax=Sphaerotilus mobilis TaxID=47994 RepID=A0A4Q7LHX3_9BURK|nr:STAS domain-containing protein [Sphaerotilus mobilis]RZS53048.1 phospholipid transport system transporter-binding protein [Sphaerotilus mobilis]